MNINKAIQRLEWRLKKGWIANQQDLDAYNSIIDFRDTQFSINLTENEPLSKLFIVYFIMLCKRHNLTSKEALNSIDDILKQDLHTWIKVLQNQIKV
ncbi:MAG: hypothetical protein GY739_22090, partial [Mesoflavibacter sp.]|nr:hypothetical protein [Mesoflavibacter sp.]